MSALINLALEVPVLAAGIWSASAIFYYGPTYIDNVDSWLHQSGAAPSTIIITMTPLEPANPKPVVETQLKVPMKEPKVSKAVLKTNDTTSSSFGDESTASMPLWLQELGFSCVTIYQSFALWHFLVLAFLVLCLSIVPWDDLRTEYKRWRREFTLARLTFSACFLPQDEYNPMIEAVRDDLPIGWIRIQSYTDPIWRFIAHPNRYTLGVFTFILLGVFGKSIIQMIEIPGPVKEQAAKYSSLIHTYIAYLAHGASEWASNAFHILHTATSPHVQGIWDSITRVFEVYKPTEGRLKLFTERTSIFRIPVLRLSALSMIPSVYYYMLRATGQRNKRLTILPFMTIVITGICGLDYLSLAALFFGALGDTIIFWSGRKWTLWGRFHLAFGLFYLWIVELIMVPLLVSVGRFSVVLWDHFCLAFGLIYRWVVMLVVVPLQWALSGFAVDLGEVERRCRLFSCILCSFLVVGVVGTMVRLFGPRWTFDDLGFKLILDWISNSLRGDRTNTYAEGFSLGRLWLSSNFSSWVHSFSSISSSLKVSTASYDWVSMNTTTWSSTPNASQVFDDRYNMIKYSVIHLPSRIFEDMYRFYHSAKLIGTGSSTTVLTDSKRLVQPSLEHLRSVYKLVAHSFYSSIDRAGESWTRIQAYINTVAQILTWLVVLHFAWKVYSNWLGSKKAPQSPNEDDSHLPENGSRSSRYSATVPPPPDNPTAPPSRIPTPLTPPSPPTRSSPKLKPSAPESPPPEPTNDIPSDITPEVKEKSTLSPPHEPRNASPLLEEHIDIDDPSTDSPPNSEPTNAPPTQEVQSPELEPETDISQAYKSDSSEAKANTAAIASLARDIRARKAEEELVRRTGHWNSGSGEEDGAGTVDQRAHRKEVGRTVRREDGGEEERRQAKAQEAARIKSERKDFKDKEAARIKSKRKEAQIVEAARIEAERKEAGARARAKEAARVDSVRKGAQMKEAARIESARKEAEINEAARIKSERAAKQAHLKRQERVFEQEYNCYDDFAWLDKERQDYVEEIERKRVAEVARLHTERIEAEQLEAERLEAERLEAERLEAERVEIERKRLETERLETARLEVERVEAERMEAERVEAERSAEWVRVEFERLEAERNAEMNRLETERLETERREAERTAEMNRLETERRETERLETARLETERLEAEQRAERIRIETERLRIQHLEMELPYIREQDRMETEHMSKAEQDRVEEEARLEEIKREENAARMAKDKAEQNEKTRQRQAARAEASLKAAADEKAEQDKAAKQMRERREAQRKLDDKMRQLRAPPSNNEHQEKQKLASLGKPANSRDNEDLMDTSGGVYEHSQAHPTAQPTNNTGMTSMDFAFGDTNIRVPALSFAHADTAASESGSFGTIAKTNDVAMGEDPPEIEMGQDADNSYAQGASLGFVSTNPANIGNEDEMVGVVSTARELTVNSSVNQATTGNSSGFSGTPFPKFGQGTSETASPGQRSLSRFPSSTSQPQVTTNGFRFATPARFSTRSSRGQFTPAASLPTRTTASPPTRTAAPLPKNVPAPLPKKAAVLTPKSTHSTFSIILTEATGEDSLSKTTPKLHSPLSKTLFQSPAPEPRLVPPNGRLPAVLSSDRPAQPHDLSSVAGYDSQLHPSSNSSSNDIPAGYMPAGYMPAQPYSPSTASSSTLRPTTRYYGPSRLSDHEATQRMLGIKPMKGKSNSVEFQTSSPPEVPFLPLSPITSTGDADDTLNDFPSAEESVARCEAAAEAAKAAAMAHFADISEEPEDADARERRRARREARDREDLEKTVSDDPNEHWGETHWQPRKHVEQQARKIDQEAEGERQRAEEQIGVDGVNDKIITLDGHAMSDNDSDLSSVGSVDSDVRREVEIKIIRDKKNKHKVR